MKNSKHTYPKTISVGKGIVKFFIVLMFFLEIYTLYVGTQAVLAGRSITSNYLISLAAPLVMGLAFLLFVCSWSNIEVRENGLSIEFLYSHLFIPWDDIISYEHYGSKQFRVRLLQVKYHHQRWWLEVLHLEGAMVLI